MLFDEPEALARRTPINSTEASNVESVSLQSRGFCCYYASHKHLCKALPLPLTDRLSTPPTFLSAPLGVLVLAFLGLALLSLGLLRSLELFRFVCLFERLLSTRGNFT